MKAAVLTGLRQIEITDVPDVQIKADTDVLLKIKAVGICGSDVHYFETGKIGSQVVQFPFIVGHECAATVSAIGGNVIGLKPDDTVVVDPAVSCDSCDQCKRDRKHTCENVSFLGTPGQRAGCLSEYIVMPEKNCYPTGDKISIAKAVVCEPLSIAAYAVQQSHLQAGDNVAVLGAGPIGLSAMLCANNAGASSCYMTEKIPERIAIASQNGATWLGNPDTQNIVNEILNQEPGGLDIIYECAGQQETIDQAVDLLRPGGKLMLIGIPRLDRISFSIDKIRRKEITIINVRRQNNCTQKAIDLIADGRIDVGFMITHHFNLEQTAEAFEMVAGYNDGVVKALIEF